MDTVISFTPGTILVLCGAIITISGAATVIINLLVKVMAPNRIQNERLDAIERKLKEHDKFFERDLKRFDEHEEGNKVIQKAILALLSHAIDNNDIVSLKEAKKNLEEYLIER